VCVCVCGVLVLSHYALQDGVWVPEWVELSALEQGNVVIQFFTLALCRDTHRRAHIDIHIIKHTRMHTHTHTHTHTQHLQKGRVEGHALEHAREQESRESDCVTASTVARDT
jgi:hypothetical protein